MSERDLAAARRWLGASSLCILAGAICQVFSEAVSHVGIALLTIGVLCIERAVSRVIAALRKPEIVVHLRAGIADTETPPGGDR